MKAIENSSMKTCGVERTKVLESKAFGGVRDAKEVDNFLSDVKLFFKFAKRESDEDKLMIILLYLVDDAKLWWHTE